MRLDGTEVGTRVQRRQQEMKVTGTTAAIAACQRGVDLGRLQGLGIELPRRASTDQRPRRWLVKASWLLGTAMVVILFLWWVRT